MARELVSPDMTPTGAACRTGAYNIQENLVVGRHLLLGYLRMAESWKHPMIGGVGHESVDARDLGEKSFIGSPLSGLSEAAVGLHEGVSHVLRQPIGRLNRNDIAPCHCPGF